MTSEDRQTLASKDWFWIPGGRAGRRFNLSAIDRGRADAESAQALPPLGRTLLARARFAGQLARCVELALDLQGSHAAD